MKILIQKNITNTKSKKVYKTPKWLELLSQIDTNDWSGFYSPDLEYLLLRLKKDVSLVFYQKPNKKIGIIPIVKK